MVGHLMMAFLPAPASGITPASGRTFMPFNHIHLRK
jgi:hypothetical protein